MIRQEFTTPIYENLIEDNILIQKEIGDAFQDLQNKGMFKPNRASNCHMLSDNTFNSNLFEKYNMPNFIHHLKMNLLNYISSINPILADPYRFFVHNAWIAWNRPGDYTHVHHHAFADISGVYYYKTNGKDGDLSLENPNRCSTTSLLYTSWQERLNIAPKEGNLILFPGWLSHNVLKNETNDDRISVSFNILLKRGPNENK